MFYRNVLEMDSTERPAQHIIENDELLDAWTKQRVNDKARGRRAQGVPFTPQQEQRRQILEFEEAG